MGYEDDLAAPPPIDHGAEGKDVKLGDGTRLDTVIDPPPAALDDPTEKEVKAEAREEAKEEKAEKAAAKKAADK